KPAGHCTSSHDLPGVHSIRQLWSLSHVVHWPGQPSVVPLSTQNPWTQDRPLVHSWPSPAGSQAKASDSRCTEQLVTDSAASPAATSTTRTAAFMSQTSGQDDHHAPAGDRRGR